MRIAVVAVGCWCGWALPLVLLQRRARKRLYDIDYALPGMIDLLVVTVEAGLGFSSALKVAAEKLQGPLGDELRLTMQEQRMGLATRDALKNMAERADTAGMRTFVRAIVQGEQLGVSIGQILRGAGRRHAQAPPGDGGGACAQGAGEDALPAGVPDLPRDVHPAARAGGARCHAGVRATSAER